MDFREGMRRIGLALGVCGAVLGGFVGYYLVDSLNQQRAHHQEFERLLSSPSLARLFDERGGKTSIDINGNPIDFVPFSLQEVHKDGIRSVHFDEEALARDRKMLRERVDWIKTEDGRSVYRSERPALGWYILALAFPLLGFLAPWGLVKALTWVAMGFSRSQQT
jgi:hypothetical protein